MSQWLYRTLLLIFFFAGNTIFGLALHNCIEGRYYVTPLKDDSSVAGDTILLGSCEKENESWSIISEFLLFSGNGHSGIGKGISHVLPALDNLTRKQLQQITVISFGKGKVIGGTIHRGYFVQGVSEPLHPNRLFLDAELIKDLAWGFLTGIESFTKSRMLLDDTAALYLAPIFKMK